jgi:Nitrile hydratase, alpha chain
MHRTLPCAILYLWDRPATKGERDMTQASGGTGSRAEWERRLIERSLEDEQFRQRLFDDPKGAVEQELGSVLPEGVDVRVLQQSQDTIYLVLPSASVGSQGGELSDQDLEAVAGGILAETLNISCAAGASIC